MRKVFFVVIVLTLPFQTKAQASFSKQYAEKYKEVLQFYPEINTGTHYIEENRSLDGHPFYLSAKIDFGTLTIGEFHFENVPLQYDIWEDWIISFSSVFNQRMILNHQKIERFKLVDGSTFVKREQPAGFLFHANGFYREIVTGETGLYAKHRKQKKQESSTIELKRSYDEVIRYFFELDGVLVPVPSKRNLFETLGISKKQAKQEIKRAGLRYKKNKEAYLQTLVSMSNNVQP
ncbi:hypothetical protein [uncultured Cyclobacterium sp.]|uniref:hypothetical protein n=1 Tax=uncultured Cyclobacterium sp. TaxID=453820 RepID=UPI0030EE3E86|tara:strand:- start:333112 stop:333813 length:702 start_codon:yes stop_codon:yes gene_type:complete